MRKYALEILSVTFVLMMGADLVIIGYVMKYLPSTPWLLLFTFTAVFLFISYRAGSGIQSIRNEEVRE